MPSVSRFLMLFVLAAMALGSAGCARGETLPPPTPSIPTDTSAYGKSTPPGTEAPLQTPIWTEPTPTLPPLSPDWTLHEFPEVGVRLQAPPEWAVLRMPGSYLLAPSPNSVPLVQVGFCCIDLPRTVPEFQEAIVPYLHNHHETNIKTTQIRGSSWEGVGVWHGSNTCLTVYIPTSEIVRQITFAPQFCEADGEHLVSQGQHILDSIEIFLPTNGGQSMP